MGALPGQIVPLPTGEISYAFLGATAPAELLGWCMDNRWRLERGRVYLRTARNLYWTPYRRISQLRRELDRAAQHPFLVIGRGCIVNVLKIASLQTAGRKPVLLFVAADGRRESLTVSRRSWPPLRERLRLPRRL